MNATEIFVKRFYHSINVIDPLQISMELIVDFLGIRLMYWNYTSVLASYQDRYVVFINESISKQQQWQEFGHEMYHYFYDDTKYDLLNESYAEYGETKADYFAYHFCVPTFMLDNFKEVSVYDVTELFNVEYDFAFRRLEMYKHRLINRRNIYGERACEISW